MSNEFFFEKLDVYQRSLKFSITICKIASNFPFKFARVRDQLIGATISVPLNIAEGSGRKSNKEKINFYKIARSSLFEIKPLIEICRELKLISDENYPGFKKEIIELSKMINGLIKTL